MKGNKCKNFEKCKNIIEDNKRSPFCQKCRSKIGRRSKRKGYTDEKRFEKYFQNQLDFYQLPYKIRRSPSSGAIHEFNPSDFYFKFLPQNSWLGKIHIEKKDRANWSIPEWISEAEEKEKEMGTLRKPIIIARKPNDTEDYVMMKKEFFTEMILQLEKLTQNER